MSLDDRQTSPTEAEVATSDDAVKGLAMVEARVGRCTKEEQNAFWEAVGRCFGGGKPPDPQNP
ncbi:hypothetical protein ACFQE0_00795 [Methylobacterium komagatae]|uniref:Uncharacterized protein n=1 Tax=Methylobacterium komagatae TaxID=374425 RepID=A0ABW2BD23_9HYPH